MLAFDEPAGNNCAFGGTRFEIGTDEDGDGQLSDTERQSTRYVCDFYGLVNGVWTGTLVIESSEDIVRAYGVVEVAGDLRVERAGDVSDLHGLDQLVSVSGDLVIAHNPGLEDISALESLASVGGDVIVESNPALASLDGLTGLSAVKGKLRIADNAALESLTHVDAITSVGGDLEILDNATLPQADAAIWSERSGLAVEGDIEVAHNADRYEPNNDSTEATSFTDLGSDAYLATLSITRDDTDWFRFDAEDADVGTFFRVLVTPVDSFAPEALIIRADAQGSEVVGFANWGPEGPDLALDHPIETAASYYVLIRADIAGERGSYNVIFVHKRTRPVGAIRGQVFSPLSGDAAAGSASVDPGARLVLDEALVRLDGAGDGDASLAALALARVRKVGRRWLVRRASAGHARRFAGAGDDSARPTMKMIARLAASPGVLGARPNFLRAHHAAPNDALYSEQKPHYDLLGLEAAWDLTTGSADTVVAVLDTGILWRDGDTAASHEDFACGRVVPGYDFVEDDDDPYDTCAGAGYHGTHVAATIGACTNDDGSASYGGAGVDWAAKILPVRVLGLEDECYGTDDAIIRGMLWSAGIRDMDGDGTDDLPANPNPAQVLNMSLGGKGYGYQDVVDRIRTETGAVIVVAAGNETDDAALYAPAGLEGIVTVGSVGPSTALSGFSNFGPKVDVLGPGGDQLSLGYYREWDGVLSAGLDPITGGFGHVFYNGTSMASPHIAGVVSLMSAVRPGLTTDQALAWLRASATMPSGCPGDATCGCSGDLCGAGLVTAAASVSLAQSAGATGPFVLAAKHLLSVAEDETEATIDLRNGGDAEAALTLATSDPALSLDNASVTIPAAGTAQVKVTLDRDATASGRYRSGIFVTGGGPELEVRVEYSVGSAVSDVGVLEVDLYRYGDWGWYMDRLVVLPYAAQAPSYAFAFENLTDGTYAVQALAVDPNDANKITMIGTFQPVEVTGGQAVEDVQVLLAPNEPSAAAAHGIPPRVLDPVD